MKVKRIHLKDNNLILTILKGSLNALIISLVAILVFAFIIKFTSISDGLIKPVNQIIKVLSVLFGCFIALKNTENNLLKGVLIGGAYTILAFVLFSALNGKFELTVSLLLDMLFGGFVGLISAIITNILKKRT